MEEKFISTPLLQKIKTPNVRCIICLDELKFVFLDSRKKLHRAEK